LDEETALALIGLRREMPHATVRSLIRVAQERRLVDCEQHLAESTVWRLLKRQGLMRREHAPVDRRRFEAELPNDIWQSDVMHGPSVRIEGKNRKAYLIAFIDDMSRLICHAQFYLSEKLIVTRLSTPGAFDPRPLRNSTSTTAPRFAPCT
jgi:hypothetical protein